MSHKSLVDKSIQLFQDLPFEIVAVPQDNDYYSNMMFNGNVSSPVNIKIRYKNKEVTGAKRGVISAPRLGASQNSKKLRLIKSDQTIMSFDLLIDTDKNKTSQKKYQNKILNIFKTGCFSTQNNDDDEYNYLPSSSVGDNTIPEVTYETNDITADKFPLRKNFSPNTRKTPIFMGKCKPGGCLDPPFNEDKYSYEPTTKLSITPKVENNKKIAQENIPDMTINTADILAKEQNDRKIKVLMQSKLDSKLLEEKFSDLIITYPPALSPSEIQMRKSSQNSAAKVKMSNERKSKQSNNEFTEIFYKPLKKDKSKNLDRSCRKQQDESVSYVNESVDYSLKNQKQRKMPVSMPENENVPTVRISNISLSKDKTGTPATFSTVTQIQVKKSITSLEKLTPMLDTKVTVTNDITKSVSLISKIPEESPLLTNDKMIKKETSLSKDTLVTQDEVKSLNFSVQDVTSTTTMGTEVLEKKDIDRIKSIHSLLFENQEDDNTQKQLMPTLATENKPLETHAITNVRNISLATQNQVILPLSINEKGKSDVDKEKDLEDKFARSSNHSVSIKDKIKTSTHQLEISKSSPNTEIKSNDHLFPTLNRVNLSASLPDVSLNGELRDSKHKDSLLIHNHENSLRTQMENIVPSFEMQLKSNTGEIPLDIENHEDYYEIKDAVEEILNNMLKNIKTNADDPTSNITLSSIISYNEFHLKNEDTSEPTLNIHQSKEIANINDLVKTNDVQIEQRRFSSDTSQGYVKNKESLENISNMDISLSEEKMLDSTLSNVDTLDIQIDNKMEHTKELSNSMIQSKLQNDHENGHEINKSILIHTSSFESLLQSVETIDTQTNVLNTLAENPDKEVIQNKNNINIEKFETVFSNEEVVPVLQKKMSITSVANINLNKQSVEEKTNSSDLKYRSTSSLSLHASDVILKSQVAKLQRGDNVNDIYAPTDFMISNNKNDMTKVKIECFDRPLSKIGSISHSEKQDIDIYKEKNNIEDYKRISEKPNPKYSKEFPINISKSGSYIEKTVMNNNNKLLRKLNSQEIDINFKFVYRVNENNGLVLQTCDPSISAAKNTNVKEAVINSIIRKYDDKIRIPLDSQTNLTLEVKKTRNNSRKSKEHLSGVDNNDLLLQETLNTVYENLLYLQTMIRNLREEAKSLSQQQVLIKELLTSLETKPERLVDHKGKCKCHKI